MRHSKLGGLFDIMARLRGSPARRVVYTCLFGFSEPLNEIEIEREKGVDYICFTDDPDLKSSTWSIKLVQESLLDPVRAAKRVKILAHHYLSEYEISLYVDNTVKLKKVAVEIFEQYLEPSVSPLVCFRHPLRSCIYDEAAAVIEAKYDDPERVGAQIAQYRAMNYPALAGLYKGAFLLRRHNDALLVEVMQTW